MGRLGGGLGVGGIVIALIAYFVFGIDPGTMMSVTEQVAPQQDAPHQDPRATKGAPSDEMGQFVAKLNADLVRALDSAEVKDIVARQGGELMASTPSEMAAQIRSDREKWGKVVRESGARIE